MTNQDEGVPGMPSCAFGERWMDATVVISCVGDIDVITASELERRLTGALHQAPTTMIVDLSDVTFLASSGMSVLVAAHQSCPPAVKLVVVANGPLTKRPMELVGVTDILTVHATLDNALKALSTQVDLRRRDEPATSASRLGSPVRSAQTDPPPHRGRAQPGGQ